MKIYIYIFFELFQVTNVTNLEFGPYEIFLGFNDFFQNIKTEILRHLERISPCIKRSKVECQIAFLGT